MNLEHRISFLVKLCVANQEVHSTTRFFILYHSLFVKDKDIQCFSVHENSFLQVIVNV